jgi:hypothetical protein
MSIKLMEGIFDMPNLSFKKAYSYLLFLAFTQLSKDGVADDRITGIFCKCPLTTAISLAL